MKKTIKILAVTMALAILGVSSVFAATTPDGIKQDYANGREYLRQINLGGVKAGTALREQTVKDHEKGMAYLDSVLIKGAKGDAVKAQAEEGYQKGQQYLTWIREQTKSAAQARDKQAEEGYEKGIAYLRWCGWDI